MPTPPPAMPTDFQKVDPILDAAVAVAPPEEVDGQDYYLTKKQTNPKLNPPKNQASSLYITHDIFFSLTSVQ